MRIFGYGRVSTKKQEKGNSLQDQRASILAKYPSAEYAEDVYTGTSIDRPVFDRVITSLSAGDMLVVTKLDRLGRSAADCSALVKGLLNRGISIHVLNMGMLDNSPVGKLTYQIMLSFAEFERDLIVERTQTGRQIAMANGVKMGRKPKYNEAQKRLVIMLKKQGHSLNSIACQTQIPKASVLKMLQDYSAEHPDDVLSEIGGAKARRTSAISAVSAGVAESTDEVNSTEATEIVYDSLSLDKLSKSELEALIKKASEQLANK